MRPQNPGVLPNRRILADVAMPHPATDGRLHCHFGTSSAKVCLGRTQAVYLSQRGIWGEKPAAFQEYWSRGCRRAHVSFSVFACWPLWQLAHLKKSLSPMWTNRFRPSQPTRASTSNKLRRADQHCLTRHVTFILTNLRHYFGRRDKFVESNSRKACIATVRHFDQHAHPLIIPRDTCFYVNQPLLWSACLAPLPPALQSQPQPPSHQNPSTTNTALSSIPAPRLCKNAARQTSRSTQPIRPICRNANVSPGNSIQPHPLPPAIRNANPFRKTAAIRSIPTRATRTTRTPLFPVRANAQTNTGGLSARLIPVLKAAAVPLMQDRSTC
jgi:hypothetical protein